MFSSYKRSPEIRKADKTQELSGLARNPRYEQLSLFETEETSGRASASMRSPASGWFSQVYRNAKRSRFAKATIGTIAAALIVGSVAMAQSNNITVEDLVSQSGQHTILVNSPYDARIIVNTPDEAVIANSAQQNGNTYLQAGVKSGGSITFVNQNNSEQKIGGSGEYQTIQGKIQSTESSAVETTNLLTQQSAGTSTQAATSTTAPGNAIPSSQWTMQGQQGSNTNPISFSVWATGVGEYRSTDFAWGPGYYQVPVTGTTNGVTEIYFSSSSDATSWLQQNGYSTGAPSTYNNNYPPQNAVLQNYYLPHIGPNQSIDTGASIFAGNGKEGTIALLTYLTAADTGAIFSSNSTYLTLLTATTAGNAGVALALTNKGQIYMGVAEPNNNWSTYISPQQVIGNGNQVLQIVLAYSASRNQIQLVVNGQSLATLPFSGLQLAAQGVNEVQVELGPTPNAGAATSAPQGPMFFAFQQQYNDPETVSQTIYDNISNGNPIANPLPTGSTAIVGQFVPYASTSEQGAASVPGVSSTTIEQIQFPI